jgi:hypothetical protein
VINRAGSAHEAARSGRGVPSPDRSVPRSDGIHGPPAALTAPAHLVSAQAGRVPRPVHERAVQASRLRGRDEVRFAPVSPFLNRVRSARAPRRG